MSRRVGLVILALHLLTGCAGRIEEIGREPDLSSISGGLPVTERTGASTLATLSPPSRRNLNSVRPLSLYRDQRATELGQILTVKIQIDDRASLDNKSNRSRAGAMDYGLSGSYGSGGATGEAEGQAGFKSNSTSKGQGKIDRSEKIELAIAAIVLDVLPNGNLLIGGTQEIRVNHEVRILSIEGLVRPEDITRDNTISYEKIAQARVSYGGRGRLMEVQQPAYGQQLLDLVMPF